MSAPVSVEVQASAQEVVSGLWQQPDRARAAMVLAHGAGAGMAHPFMSAVARGLGARGIATLRYQFPYMERGSRRPDAPALAQATVRAAVAKAAELAPDLPLFAAGKSFGGRMSSQAQAESPLPGVKGLVFFGFPLHPPGKPGAERGAHLSRIRIPMLFLQGTRDEFAQPELLNPLVEGLGPAATLLPLADANHSFKVPRRSGRTDAQLLDEVLDAAAQWVDRVVALRTGT